MQPSVTDATGGNATAQLPGWAVDAGLPARALASAIAKARGLNKGTVSRYLANHPELRGSDGLVDVVAFNTSYQTNRAVISSAIGAAARAPQQGELPVDEQQAKANADGAASAMQRRRQEELRTRGMELDLAEREGSMVSIEQVTSSRAAIAVTLRDKLVNVDIAFAEKLIAEVHNGAEPRQIVAILSAAHRELLAEIVTALEREVPTVKQAAETEQDAA